MTEPKDRGELFEAQSAAATSLEHARCMLQFQAELRVKNFNFFLVLSGAIVVALSQWPDDGIRGILCILGAVLAGMFFLLDVRGARLVKDARHDLYRFEAKFGLSIHDADKIADRRRGIVGGRRARVFSHTFCYRAVFSMVALLFVFGGLVAFGALKRTFATPQKELDALVADLCHFLDSTVADSKHKWLLKGYTAEVAGKAWNFDFQNAETGELAIMRVDPKTHAIMHIRLHGGLTAKPEPSATASPEPATTSQRIPLDAESSIGLIEESMFLFKRGNTETPEPGRHSIEEVAREIESLATATTKANLAFSVIVVGHADNDGSRMNDYFGAERAMTIAQRLRKHLPRVEPNRIVSLSSGSRLSLKMFGNARDTQRCVSLYLYCGCQKRDVGSYFE